MDGRELINQTRRQLLRAGVSTSSMWLSRATLVGTALAATNTGADDFRCIPPPPFDPHLRPPCVGASPLHSHQKLVACFNRQQGYCFSESDPSRHKTVYEAHAKWHTDNQLTLPDPVSSPEPTWAMGESIGTEFLTKHRFMLNSIASWYGTYGQTLPPTWNVIDDKVPGELDFVPECNDLPRGIMIGKYELYQWVKDHTNNQARRRLYRRDFPEYFLKSGMTDSTARGEPRTGARRLADFKNTNQLGCCLLFLHALWHEQVNGVMQFLETSIIDPLFYFGVHYRIEQIFREYQAIRTLQRDYRNDPQLLIDLDAHESPEHELILSAYEYKDKEFLVSSRQCISPERRLLSYQK